MTARMIDPVEGWMVEQAVEPTTGHEMLHVTRDGGEIDPLGPVYVNTPAAVHAILGEAAFQRLEPVRHLTLILF